MDKRDSRLPESARGAQPPDRRTLLRAGTRPGRCHVVQRALPGCRRDPDSSPVDARLLPGFKVEKVRTSGATLHTVIGGSGPPLLLIHGAPLTHLSWFRVAPELAKKYTVIAPDLRGYGDSSKPEDGENHVNYSKRTMAQDKIELMKHFGFDRFAVVGHDRGGRVAHRLALDHPQAVTRMAVIDIVPTYYLYTHVTKAFVDAYFHWFLYIRPAPFPEKILNGDVEGNFGRGAPPELRDEYLRVYRDPAQRARHVRGLSRFGRCRHAVRRGRPRQEDRLPAARAVGEGRRDGTHVRRAGHLEGTRHDGHWRTHARRTQLPGNAPAGNAGAAAAIPGVWKIGLPLG